MAQALSPANRFFSQLLTLAFRKEIVTERRSVKQERHRLPSEAVKNCFAGESACATQSQILVRQRGQTLSGPAKRLRCRGCASPSRFFAN